MYKAIIERLKHFVFAGGICEEFDILSAYPGHSLVVYTSYILGCSVMENTPLVSFDSSNSTSGSYIGKVMMGSIPKMLIIVSTTYSSARI